VARPLSTSEPATLNAIGKLTELASRALAVAESKPKPDDASTIDSLRDLALRAKKLHFAAARPACLGFFGPSQAGKSFLVGALLSHELGSLEVIARDRKLDFLSKINPAKGVESTGVVTRFSTRPLDPPLQRGDFVCRLLSLETLLASMATGFLVECTSPHVEADVVETCLRDARLAQGPAAPAAFREAWETVWHDLGKKYQDRHPYLSELRRHATLSSGSWKADVRTTRGWLSVYSLLWGGPKHAPDIERLMDLLVEGLEVVGHAESVEAEAANVEASSQGASLIDAGCLNAVGGAKVPVRVYLAGKSTGAGIPDPQAGREVTVDAGILAALITEIHLAFAPAPGSLLEHADILDFPGGRALKGINGFGKAELSTGRLEHAIEVYKRGKLTHLFEQYAALREITGLCLCSPGPTKPEAIQLQSQVEQWLKIRHGAATPQVTGEVERPSLFVALTKFDMSLGALRSDNASDRWESRVQEACVDFWARNPSSWILNWGQRGRAFDNLFWIRNPYADQMRSLAPGHADFEKVKSGFFAARAVQRHMAHSQEKWAAVEGDDASGLPKSGVPLLAARMRDKLAENVKGREILAEAQAVHEELAALLKALAPSRSAEEEKERIALQAKLLVDAVSRAMGKEASGAPFGRLVDTLTVDEATVTAEVAKIHATVAPMSIKTSDKVKRMIVHLVRAWRDEATRRFRESALELPKSAVDVFIREICGSKKLLPPLGVAVYPYLSRPSVDAVLVASIVRAKICDAMIGLGAKSARRTPQGPVRLSSSSAPRAAGTPDGSDIDWSDVDLNADESAPASIAAPASSIVFAGNRFFTTWCEGLPRFYLENRGEAVAPGEADARGAELSAILRDVEGTHVRAA
jgi:hypothetical protein